LAVSLWKKLDRFTLFYTLMVTYDYTKHAYGVLPMRWVFGSLL
jgi:hypothetical protein